MIVLACASAGAYYESVRSLKEQVGGLISALTTSTGEQVRNDIDLMSSISLSQPPRRIVDHPVVA
ncbi:hypothetical protein [Curtobacterium sp. MCBD17_040]|uniref:hypothetical protein n=1 Tax=Curtobacterium sp. MCBD17_040 TaxID=2175674 RepID=UPI000DA725C0|nr:hypothetical protein [Curtobacterium sp. MCBD17_040]WIB65874.1 hypothetical protein DEI94_17315 [Curtobacterium sp. MCBD17_040]